MQIAVVGGGVCSPEACETARRLGWLLASRGHILLCGGRGGVMEAACRGAHEGGGLSVGILPGEREEANSFVDISIVTGMGQARNAIIVKSTDGPGRRIRTCRAEEKSSKNSYIWIERHMLGS